MCAGLPEENRGGRWGELASSTALFRGEVIDAADKTTVGGNIKMPKCCGRKVLSYYTCPLYPRRPSGLVGNLAHLLVVRNS